MSVASHNHIEIVLNGHTIVGFSDEQPPYNLIFEPTSERRIGPAGNVYTNHKALQGAEFTVSLAPHSPSVQWFIERDSDRIQRDRNKLEGPFFSGTIIDVAKNIIYSLDGGFIVNIPRFTAAFENYVPTLYFETVDANVAGGRFSQRITDNG